MTTLPKVNKPKDYKPAAKPPIFTIGQYIASGEVAGKVSTCFWLKGQWNYTIEGLTGVDRNIAEHESADNLRLGNAYIAESNVKWGIYGCPCGWIPLLEEGEVHVCNKK